MIEKKVENKKADVKPTENRSIKSLKLDIALCQYIHSREVGNLGPTRMKQILTQPQFTLLSEASIRKHLKSLCARNVLKEDSQFRGQYVLDEGAYHDFCKDLQRYLEQIIGPDFYHAIVKSLRPF
ncbi:MAG TPA: hypothetical protein VMZ04_03560 [Anaerolineae bacterium]|nr:hypothetical protein [Anaerolineae bacterium]